MENDKIPKISDNKCLNLITNVLKISDICHHFLAKTTRPWSRSKKSFLEYVVYIPIPFLI